MEETVVGGEKVTCKKEIKEEKDEEDKEKVKRCPYSGRKKDGCTCFGCFKNWSKSNSRPHASSTLPSSQPSSWRPGDAKKFRLDSSSSQPCNVKLERDNDEAESFRPHSTLWSQLYNCKERINGEFRSLPGSQCTAPAPTPKPSSRDDDEPLQKKSKLKDDYDDIGDDVGDVLHCSRMPVTELNVEKLDPGTSVVQLSTAVREKGLARPQGEVKDVCGVKNILDTIPISDGSDSDITLPDITSTVSDNSEEESDVEEVKEKEEEEDGKVERKIKEEPGSPPGEKLPDSEILFNYSQEDAVILISSDDDEENNNGGDNDDDDDNGHDDDDDDDLFSSRFIDSDEEFTEVRPKNLCKEIKKEPPDFTKSEVKSDSEESVTLFEEIGEKQREKNITIPTSSSSSSSNEKPGPEGSVKKRKPTSSENKVNSPKSLMLKSLWKGHSSSSDEDEDDKHGGSDKSHLPSNSLHALPKSTGTVSQWLNKHGNKGKLLSKNFSSSSSTSNDDDFDDDDDKLYMCVTQVEEDLYNRGKTKTGRNLDEGSLLVNKSPQNKMADVFNSGSSKAPRDSGQSSNTTSKESRNAYLHKKTSIPMTTQKGRVGSKASIWKLDSDDSDSDSTIYSMATQVDCGEPRVLDVSGGNNSHNNNNYLDDDDDDDGLFIINTQVDPVPGKKYSLRTQLKLTDSGSGPLSKTKLKRLSNTVNNDIDSDDDDDLFIVSTQVDPLPGKKSSFKTQLKLTDSVSGPLSKTKLKRPSNTINEDVGSDDSQFSIATQVDPFPGKKMNVTSKLKLTGPSSETKGLLEISDDDSDSDDSLFSVSTQVDSSFIPPKSHPPIKKNILSEISKPMNFYGHNRETPKTKMSEFKMPKFPHKKHSHNSSSGRTMADKKYSHSSRQGVKSLDKEGSVKSKKTSTMVLKSFPSQDSDDEYESDTSIFSMATQIDDCNDKDKNDDDELFFQATQVDTFEPKRKANFVAGTKLSSPKGTNNFKIPQQPLKKMTESARQLLEREKMLSEDYDSDESLFSVVTQICDVDSLKVKKVNKEKMSESTSKNSSRRQHHFRSDFPPTKTKTSKHASASSSSFTSTSKPKVSDDDSDDQDDVLFAAATQIDEPALYEDTLTTVSSSSTSTTSSSSTTATAVSPFTDFLLGIAATESSSSVKMVSSKQKIQEDHQREEPMEVENEESKTEPGYADFLLSLSKDSDTDAANKKESAFAKPFPVAKISEISLQRFKSKKESREEFKQQKAKANNQNKTLCRAPVKMPGKVFSPCSVSLMEKTESKNSRPLPVRKERRLTEKLITEGISNAKNQLEGRFYFMSLAKTPVKRVKSSTVAVDSPSLGSDVTLPDADKIKKLGLPIIETPKRRRPLPETVIKNHPEESQELMRSLSPVIDSVTSPLKCPQNRPVTPPLPVKCPQNRPVTLPLPVKYPQNRPVTLPLPVKCPQNRPVSLPLPVKCLQNRTVTPPLVNNRVTSCSSSGSNSSRSSNSSQSTPYSPTQTMKTIPLFENSNKCFGKDFQSFHIPKIKKNNPYQTTKVSPGISAFLEDKPDSSNPEKPTVSSEGPKSTSSYPKPSLIYSALKTGQPTFRSTNSPKRVSFASVNNSVCTVPTQAQWCRPSQETNKDLLRHLLRWNTKWLDEQSTLLSMPPPIYPTDQLYPLLQTYSSYADYVNVIQPLLLLEIWESIYRQYNENKTTSYEIKAACYGASKINASQMDYVLYGVTSEAEQSNCIIDGDFIIMKLLVSNTLNSGDSSSSTTTTTTTTTTEYPVFGFVTRVNCYYIHNHDDVLDRFPDLAVLSRTIPNAKMFRAIVKCHYRKLSHCFTKLIKIQPLTSIVPFLRQYKALMKFTSNPLHTHILNPAGGAAVVTGSGMTIEGNYNNSQKKAISAAAEMSAKPQSKPCYCLVQGPPGTGKSHTIIGMIKKIKEQNPNSKILLCAPSNGAVDELMRRLMQDRQKAQAESRPPIKFLRIGNPRYIHRDVVKYSLSNLISFKLRPNTMKQSSMLAEIQQYSNELKQNDEEILRMFDQPKSSLRDEKIRKLKKDQRYVKDKLELLKRQLENNQIAMRNVEPSTAEKASARRDLFSNADVICGTLSTCGGHCFITELADQYFSCIIIDEASQCCELDNLIPLQYNCCKMVLIGDTEQLSPTVISQLATEYNYGQSLFERLCKYFKYNSKDAVIMLNVQYRMHPDICEFPNRYIYDGQLTSHSELVARYATVPIVPYMLFDVQFGFHVRSSDSSSLSNPMEADFTVCLCDCLSHVSQKMGMLLKIAVIAPYRQQKMLLENLLSQRKLYNVDVTTVDGFQGRENDIIVLSCVRANSSTFGNIGFLKNRRRLNVALTRAKFALYIVGHLSSLEGDEDWKSLIQDAHERHLVLPVRMRDNFVSVVKKCIKV